MSRLYSSWDFILSGAIAYVICKSRQIYLKTAWTLGVVAFVGAQVFILLGFIAPQWDRILHGCVVKITHPITKLLLLNILSLEIGGSWGKVVASDNQAIFYKRGLRSQVKVRNPEYTFWILRLVVSYSFLSPCWLERRSANNRKGVLCLYRLSFQQPREVQIP